MLKFCRVEQEGSLVVDGGVVVTGSSPGLLNQLNINNGLYLGKDRNHFDSHCVFNTSYRKRNLLRTEEGGGIALSIIFKNAYTSDFQSYE